MAIFTTVREFFGFLITPDIMEEDEVKADDNDGPLIAHRHPDGTIIRYEASESLLKAAALAAGSVPPPDLR
ncbi:MAG: hypothetical protein ACR2RF_28700 [Geminicoccaceae bacterium]